MGQVVFRNATVDDAAKLVEIYRYYVEETAITFEWTVPTVEEFRSRMEQTMKKYPYIVAEVEGQLIGYAYAGAFVAREAYDRCVEATIYLHRNYRGRSVGKRMYALMEHILKRMNILNIYVCIAYPETDDEYLTTNSAAFHAHLGWRTVGRFKKCGYKFGRWYDMIWMEKMIGSHTKCPSDIHQYCEIKDELIGTVLRS